MRWPRALVVAACVAAMLGAGLAQRTTRKAKTPRALALVEWPAAGSQPRLIPIAIMIEGRFYDASIYLASPVPMAIDPGTVYDVEQSGESIGIVTLTGARMSSDGAWTADARFQSKEQLAAAARPKAPPKPTEPPEGPPTLRRGGSTPRTPPTASAPAGAGTQTSSAPTASSDDSDRPRLKKPEEEKPAPPAPTGAPAAASPATPGAAQSGSAAAAATKSGSDDSGRPVLRHDSGGKQAEALPGGVDTKGPAKSPLKGGAAAAGKPKAPVRVLAAISDAGGPEPKSLVYKTSGDELQKMTRGVEQLATAALEAYAKPRPAGRPGKLENVQVKVFDLSYDNEPVIVLTAAAGEAPAQRAPARTPAGRRGAAMPKSAPDQGTAASDLVYWVTFVARQDYNGDLRKLAAAVTDNRHLDAFPRLELIDAVDADGDGRAELLFRQVSDIGHSYVLYRATPDRLTELYDSSGPAR